MANQFFKNFNNELIKKGLVFKNKGEYEETQSLDSIYIWGYILKYQSKMLKPIYNLYDNNDCLICSLHTDYDKWNIINNILTCKRMLPNNKKEFTYDLNDGAIISPKDVVTCLYVDDTSLCGNSVLFINRNDVIKAYHTIGATYIEDITNTLKNGLVLTQEDIDFYISQGYEILPHKYFQSNLDYFNNLILTELGGI